MAAHILIRGVSLAGDQIYIAANDNGRYEIQVGLWRWLRDFLMLQQSTELFLIVMGHQTHCHFFQALGSYPLLINPDCLVDELSLKC